MTMLRTLTMNACGAMLAASLGAPTALADVYVWTDDAGVKHVSNLPPPEGVRGVSVTRSRPSARRRYAR
jgi:hypothetical protein